MKLRLTHNPEYAHFLPRLGAQLADNLIWLFPALWVLSGWSQLNSLQDLGVAMISDSILVLLPLAFIQMLLNIWLISRFGASPGKWFFGLRVVQEENHKNVSLGRSAVRYLIAKPLNSFFFDLSYLMILFDAKHQGLHDKISATVVREDRSKRVQGLIALVLLLAGIGFWTTQIAQTWSQNLPALRSEVMEIIDTPESAETNQ